MGSPEDVAVALVFGLLMVVCLATVAVLVASVLGIRPMELALITQFIGDWLFGGL